MNERPGLLIYGAGGHALAVRAAALKQGLYDIVGYVVDNAAADDDGITVSPRIPFAELSDRHATLPKRFIVAIGDNVVRRERQKAMQELGFEPVNVIHPFTNVSNDVKIGRGVYISPGVSIDPDVEIGDGVILNVKSAVGHGARIGSFAHVGPGVLFGADSMLGEQSFIAMGAIVISGVDVGADCFVGTGAVVTKTVPDDMVAVGSPARVRRREPVVSDDSPNAKMSESPAS